MYSWNALRRFPFVKVRLSVDGADRWIRRLLGTFSRHAPRHRLRFRLRASERRVISPGRPPAASSRRLISIGAWLQMVHLHLFGMRYGNAWPLLLIAVGAGIALRAVFDVTGGRDES